MVVTMMTARESLPSLTSLRTRMVTVTWSPASFMSVTVPIGMPATVTGFLGCSSGRLKEICGVIAGNLDRPLLTITRVASNTVKTPSATVPTRVLFQSSPSRGFAAGLAS